MYSCLCRSQGGHCVITAPLTDLVLHAVDLVVFRVDGTDEHVVRDVVEVAPELEPRTGHGDVVRGALALRLHGGAQTSNDKRVFR